MKYGAFEIVSELHRGPRASVHAGRREGSAEDRFAIKVVEPNVSIIGQRAAEQRCEAFLESMRVQELAASGSAQHWVRVHETGRLEAAAFAAMDRYRSSVEELVTFRRDAEAEQLYQIISGVVTGLKELDGKFRRAAQKLDVEEAGVAPNVDDEQSSAAIGRCHGNLKPSNVMLGDGDAVALMDPATDAQLAENQLTVRDDLRAVGNLIHALVLHREWRGGFGAKVDSGGPWNKLGRTGDGWYRLCSALVEGEGEAYDAQAPTSLDELEAAVAALSPAAKAGSSKPMFIAAAIVGVALVVGIAAFSLRGGEEPATDPGDVVVTPPVDVIADAQQVDDPQPPPMDPDQKPPQQLTPLQRAWLSALQEDRAIVTSFASLRTLSDEQQPSEAQIRAAVNSAISEVSGAWQTFQANGWQGVEADLPQPVSEFEQSLHEEDPEQDQVLLEQIQRAAAARGLLEREVEIEWQVFKEATQRISRAGDDPALSQFASAGTQRIASVSTLRALRQSIRDYNQMAKDLARTVEANWSRIDHEYFRDQSGLYPPPSEPDLAYYERWINEATSGEYGRIDERPSPPEFATVLGELERMLMQIDAACGSDASREPLQLLRQQQRDLVALPWDGSRETAQQHEQAIDAFERQVTDVRSQLSTQLEVCRNCVAELERQLQIEPDVTGSLRAYWNDSKAVIAAADTQCDERVQRVQALREGLVKLDQDLDIPLAGRWSDPQMRAAAAQRRDAIAGEALTGVNVLEVELDEQQWDETRAELDAWIESAEAWLDAHDALAEALAQLPRFESLEQPFDAWREQAGQFAAFSHVADPTRRRLEALRDIETRTLSADGRREMLEVLKSAANPELRAAAWWRLGETMSDPDALVHEQEAWQHIEPVLAELDQQRRNDLLSNMHRERQRRWIAHTQRIDSVGSLVDAIEVRAVFGIEDNALDPWLEFNVHLHAYLQEVEGASDEALCEQSQRLLDQISRLWPDETQQPQRVQVVRMRLVGMQRACSGEGTDFSGVGPGAMGWLGTVEDEGRLLRFDPPQGAAGQGDQTPLYFRRVNMPDSRLVFMSTTEVSLGLFRDVLRERASDMSQWLPRSPRGAQGWQREQDEIVLRDRWLSQLSPTAGFQCVGELSTPMPDHPAHQVNLPSALFVASQLGARLPTVDEWQAAVEQVYPDGQVPATAANRRGQEWVSPLRAQVQSSPRHEWWLETEQEATLQRNNPMSGEIRPDVPFADSFVSESQRDHLYSFSVNDGELWFRPVYGDSVTGATAFRDLIGNVAEFVLSSGRAFSAVAATTLSIDEYRQMFDDDESLQVYVVGGSALSDPAVAPEEPLLHDVRRARLNPWPYGYADVGFRLVIEMQPGQEPTASPRSIADRLRANPPYVLASGG